MLGNILEEDEVSMAHTPPRVWVSGSGSETRAELELCAWSEPDIRLDSVAWLAWLERPASSSFAYPIYDRRAGYIRSFMTVRKERRRRGTHYWVAYQRVGGRLCKIYLGRSVQVTQQQLETVAARFLARADLELNDRKEVRGQITDAASSCGEATTW
jgi:hypothetical protein